MQKQMGHPVNFLTTMIYRVTIRVVPDLLLTSKQKFCFSIWFSYKNVTFVLQSTGGLAQPEWSPCIYLDNLEELWLEAVLDPALEHVCDVGVLEVLLHVHHVG